MYVLTITLRMTMENEKEKFKALLYDEACKAIDLGWTIIPLSISGKVPLNDWKKYQT